MRIGVEGVELELMLKLMFAFISILKDPVGFWESLAGDIMIILRS